MEQFAHFLAQVFGQVGEFVGREPEIFVEPVPNLLGAVLEYAPAFNASGKFRIVEVVDEGVGHFGLNRLISFNSLAGLIGFTSQYL